MKIRPGQLEGFKRQAAELIRLTNEEDAQTIRYDWFISRDGTDCEAHEAYVNSEGLIEHNANIAEARGKLFGEFAEDHLDNPESIDTLANSCADSRSIHVPSSN